MINRYKFDIVLLCQQNTTMHGPGENHTGYIYARALKTDHPSPDILCDPMFIDSWNIVKNGIHTISDFVCRNLTLEVNAPRSKPFHVVAFDSAFSASYTALLIEGHSKQNINFIANS